MTENTTATTATLPQNWEETREVLRKHKDLVEAINELVNQRRDTMESTDYVIVIGALFAGACAMIERDLGDFLLLLEASHDDAKKWMVEWQKIRVLRDAIATALAGGAVES